MKANINEPIIWMNVTTSANWKRPPVGIVRVEVALCAELLQCFGPDKFKRCVWMDNTFVEFLPGTEHRSPEIDSAVDIIFPRTQSFDLPRRFLARAFGLYQRKQSKRAESMDSSNVEIIVDTARRRSLQPIAGDFLISVGLDWDQQYTSAFFSLSKDKGVRIITCIYDLIPVLFPQYCVGEVANRFKEYFNMLTWGSSAVLCISEQTRRDYLSLCRQIGSPERPTKVIPLGDQVYKALGDLSAPVQAVLFEPFILFVSTIERRKNHEVLYRAYHLLCAAGHRKVLPKLIFVGMPGWGVGDLLKDIELDPLTQGLIIQLNHVSDAELCELYKRARFSVYPSLYEGWGLPVGEALAAGKAVLASDQGSLPEVGGDLVCYLDPWNPKVWADAILELSTSPSVVVEMERRVAQCYRPRAWADAAKCVVRLVEELSQTSRTAEKVLYPGYDFSTQVGQHFGSRIRSTGASGFLLYGPHRSLEPGEYTITMFDLPGDRTPGIVTVDFVANRGEKCFWKGGVQIPSANLEEETPFLQFNVSIEEEVSDYEIRCIIGPSRLTFTKIVLARRISWKNKETK